MMKPKYFVLVCAFGLSGLAQGQIRRVIDFRGDGSNPAWSPDGRVLYERQGHIVLAGTNPDADRVLTSGIGISPAWHPSGRYFAFVSQGRILFRNPESDRVLDSIPAAQAKDLRFSRDGARLAWMDAGMVRIRAAGAVHPVLFPAGIKVTAIDDFSADGRALLVTARGSYHTEIFACDLARPRCRPLTDNPRQRQDFARLSPSGQRIVFASSETAWVPEAPVDYESDFWIAPLDGAARAVRITWFGEPANPRYDPERARVNAACWSPDGRWLLATITEGPKQDHSRLVKIEFPEPE